MVACGSIECRRVLHTPTVLPTAHLLRLGSCRLLLRGGGLLRGSLGLGLGSRSFFLGGLRAREESGRETAGDCAERTNSKRLAWAAFKAVYFTSVATRESTCYTHHCQVPPPA